ncbi:MAG: DNA primase [Nitrospira sp.]|jgi:hypothetical protein|nr:MAG: DNA primase [Nitrospira sp.]
MSLTLSRLRAQDYAALESESWIDAATAEAFKLSRVSRMEGAELVGRTDRGDYAGIRFPIYWPGDPTPREHHLRREHPPVEDGKQKQKYLAPPGRGNMLLFGPNESVEALTDPACPIILVEGLKKLLAAYRLSRWETTEPRFLPCAISGVWNWRGRIGKTSDATGARVDEKGPIPDLARISWPGRDVVVIFDSDCATNDKIAAARRGLVAELRKRGARVGVVDLPALDGLDKTGFDDLVAQRGPEEALVLIQKTIAEQVEARADITPSAEAAQLHTPPALAQEPNILAKFEKAIGERGMVGEERCAKVLYLAFTSRLLDQPVSVAIKGLSSSGKSFTTETTLKFFPATAYISMTAMSERALIYMKDDFQHRTLVIFEAVALREEREKNESNLTAYFVRSLLSEGRIAYPVTVRDKQEGFVTKTIVKEGPTNVILTTTSTELHGENETRLLSLPTNDSPEQTKAVMRRLAEGMSHEVNVQEWHALQNWLAVAEHRVIIPFSTYLADAIPPMAVRLRRDFKTLLRLIETHALLQQCSRDRDAEGRIIATPEDYFTVRGLVADLFAAGVGATVPHTIRETVQAVQRIDSGEGATVLQIAKELKLDRSAAQRRTQAARERGYLANLEEKRGRPARYAIGEPLPQELELLPSTLPGCARSFASTHSFMHSVSSSVTKDFMEGVQVCSEFGEEMEVITDVA